MRALALCVTLGLAAPAQAQMMGEGPECAYRTVMEISNYHRFCTDTENGALIPLRESIPLFFDYFRRNTQLSDDAIGNAMSRDLDRGLADGETCANAAAAPLHALVAANPTRFLDDLTIALGEDQPVTIDLAACP